MKNCVFKFNSIFWNLNGEGQHTDVRIRMTVPMYKVKENKSVRVVSRGYRGAYSDTYSRRCTETRRTGYRQDLDNSGPLWNVVDHSL